MKWKANPIHFLKNRFQIFEIIPIKPLVLLLNLKKLGKNWGHSLARSFR